MSAGWFWFERSEYRGIPRDSQSPFLDELFLSEPNCRIAAAWCVSCADERLIFFWGDRRAYKGLDLAQPRSFTGRYRFYNIYFIRYFNYFCANRSALNTPKIIAEGNEEPIKYIDSVNTVDDYCFEILAGGGVAFYYQIIRSEISNDNRIAIRTSLQRLSEAGYEYSVRARRHYELVPKDLLKISSQPNVLFNQYFGPNSFGVGESLENVFTWPWQRSLQLKDGVFCPKEIPTTSLVMDLRNSSSAMLLTREPPEYAYFVESVVHVSREIITARGGYFDKETGDGVVGHFDGRNGGGGGSEMVLNAMFAAREITEKVTTLCRKYQDQLSIPLAGLGCSIGIYFGKAVWLHSWSGIRAIGMSVVNASRLCGNAGPGEVAFCGSVASVLKESGEKYASILNGVVKRRIKVSEVRESAQPEAYFLLLDSSRREF